MTDHTPLDRALAGEVVKLADERLAEMQQYPYMHPDWPRAITELIATRKEIERLTRENEDFLDERQRRIHEILRLRAALDSLLTALNFRDSGERLFAVYGMPAIDAANAAAALLRDGGSATETEKCHE